MKYRIAKKIVKNKEKLAYKKKQVKRAETVMARYDRNKDKKPDAPSPKPSTEDVAPVSEAPAETTPQETQTPDDEAQA